MPTIDDLSEHYANFLLPVLPKGPGVCPICHTSIVGNWPTCISCRSARDSLPFIADAIGFVSLAVKNQQLAHELAFYKGNYEWSYRYKTIVSLTAVLWRWLKFHEQCVARSSGVEAFQIVTTIPSTRNRDNHPLPIMVGEKIGVTLDRYEQLLRPRSGAPDNREYLSDRFLVSRELRSSPSVLIIDDTFTRGSRVQSAATALRNAGASRVGVICIGRHFAVNQRDEFGAAAKSYYEQSQNRGWDWSRCCLCDT